ncbi:DNA-binding LacI/PurR family transcriptional regulator [Microbacterium sp. W4I4]|uniref:LacI family DNA-binding transcriptional regulator n=1 Tax=Microbacterium sp. W4I4 TaxID=3042295 RepID=UPI00277F119B|nr:LacI family DNA-binding transcriptional regulator [Microbacterium sp. W4I4]MDQ0613998.1 DNA-binding LacI/PurR family transcriptional regulator [Microbacterium sp. W4I4]
MTQVARRATALDVARAAGVSKTTVSYVLNDTPNQQIPEHTRQRVYDAVRELDYTPSSAARALRRGRNDVVLLILPDWPLTHVMARILDELTNELQRSDLVLLTRRRQERQSLVTMSREVMPAAVIAFGEIDRAELAVIQAGGTYVASALLAGDTALGRAVVVPQEHIGEFQLQHLVSRGHTRIGYATITDPQLESFIRLRVQGARLAALQRGLDAPEIIDIGSSFEGAKAAVESWLAEGITGVAAYNDQVAAALLAAMRALGLSAPGDLALIGVDDEPLSRFLVPPLTTVRQNEQMIAQHMAKVVVEGIAGRPAPHLSSANAIEVIDRESA